MKLFSTHFCLYLVSEVGCRCTDEWNACSVKHISVATCVAYFLNCCHHLLLNGIQLLLINLLEFLLAGLAKLLVFLNCLLDFLLTVCAESFRECGSFFLIGIALGLDVCFLALDFIVELLLEVLDFCLQCSVLCHSLNNRSRIYMSEFLCKHGHWQSQENC